MTKRYSEQFKKDAVLLMQSRGSKTVRQVARELGMPKANLLYRWRERYGVELGCAPSEAKGPSELEALRKKLRELEWRIHF